MQNKLIYCYELTYLFQYGNGYIVTKCFSYYNDKEDVHILLN